MSIYYCIIKSQYICLSPLPSHLTLPVLNPPYVMAHTCTPVITSPTTLPIHACPKTPRTVPDSTSPSGTSSKTPSVSESPRFWHSRRTSFWAASATVRWVGAGSWDVDRSDVKRPSSDFLIRRGRKELELFFIFINSVSLLLDFLF